MPFEGAPCTYDEPSGKSRFPTEFQKMHHRAIADNGIFRIYDQLNRDDVIASRSQSIQDTEGVSACSQSAFQYREKASSSDRASLRMHSCYLGGPPALQISTAFETSGSGAKRKPLRSFYTDVSGSTAGSMVVDPQSLNQSLPSDTEAVSCSHPGDRCLHSRLGGLLSGVRYEDRRSVVNQRPEKSYQLAGTPRSLSGSTEFFDKEARNTCATDDGQSSSHFLHQQDGRYTLSEALQPCPAAVELVHTEVSNGPRRACTRSTECNCRLREQTFQRFQRLETGPRSVSGSEPNVRTIHSRPVCLIHECTDGGVLQLEAGPQVSGNRCSSTAMGLPPSLPVSSVCTDWSLPAEDSQREGTDGYSNSSNLARSDVVSSPPRHVEGAPQETPNTQSIDSEPLEGTTSSSTAGTSDPSRMAYIRRSLSDKGISGEAADIICSSWRTSTSKSYNSCWNRWTSWCESRKINPVSTDVADLILFLTELYKEGKQYSTINSYRSSISVSHQHVEGAPIGKHPTVIRFMQGIFNSRPPMPRYSFVWDIEVVLGHIKSMPSSSQLSIQQLSWKLVTLMALTNADRASDLHLKKFLSKFLGYPRRDVQVLHGKCLMRASVKQR